MSEERIPTMPQGEPETGERIPTMPQGEPETGERIPTMPQGMADADGRIATMPQSAQSAVEDENGRVATAPQQGMNIAGGAGARLLTGSNVSFTGDKGQNYVVEAYNVISADSGESQIYGCHKESNSARYVARILLSVTPDSDIEKRRTRDKVIKFLDDLSWNEDSHILPLLDYGTVQINGKDYYVEIYPFCEDGDLGRQAGKISYSQIKDEIVPALNEALHYFHVAGFVHRDVKPDNIYRYKGKIVLGDFGITCDLRSDGFATDRQKRGTLGYYAPELMSQAALKESDYYSLGQTIWTLYNGEMMYGSILRRYKDLGQDEQRSQVNFAMLNNNYIGLDEIGKGDEFLEILIRGLLQYDPAKRFGYEQVNLWVAGDRSIVHELGDYGETKTFSRSFDLLGKECWDDKDICSQLCNNWSLALDALYDGRVKDIYASQDYDRSQRLGDIMKKYSTNSDKDLIPLYNNIGLAKTILLLSQNKILCWEGRSFRDMLGIANALGEILTKKADYGVFYRMVGSGIVREWYADMKGSQSEVRGALREIEEMLKKSGDWSTIALYWLVYLVKPKSLDSLGCENLHQYMTHIFGDDGRLYGDGKYAMEPITNDLSFMGLLCAWGYSEHVTAMRNSAQNTYAIRYEQFFDFLEQQSETDEDRAEVRRFYNKYGPQAYLLWWRDNLSIYSYVGAACEKLRRDAEAVKVDENAPIAEQRREFGKLATLAVPFQNYMESDLYLGSVGIQGFGDEYIYTNHLSGLWHYKFLEQTAPVGFKFYMGF